jgi:hypothetical protein
VKLWDELECGQSVQKKKRTTRTQTHNSTTHTQLQQPKIAQHNSNKNNKTELAFLLGNVFKTSACEKKAQVRVTRIPANEREKDTQRERERERERERQSKLHRARERERDRQKERATNAERRRCGSSHLSICPCSPLDALSVVEAFFFALFEATSGDFSSLRSCVLFGRAGMFLA